MQFLHDKEAFPCLSSASFWVPDLINLSAWTEHAPFAFWLVNTIHPDTIVELGTHQGYSYFVFCQAVRQLELSTRCYAIDTWKGDEHSGFYGEEIFQDVSTHNDQHYSGFSRLMRSTFDDGLEYFLDGSIDVLHIDGRHFYEDIKHDFESWLPKLSDRAVVLFHDTNVKERQFGIFRFWDELCQLYPNFEFIHGNGLGVLGVGKSISAELHTLFDAKDNGQAADIRTMYSRLGAALTNRYQLATQTIQINQRVMEEEKLRAELNTSHILKNELEQQRSEYSLLIKEKEKIKIDMEVKQQIIQQLQNRLTELQAVSKEKDVAIEYLNRAVTDIYSSKSWRWSWPFRKLGQIFS